MSHYYEFDPSLRSEIKEIYYDYRGKRLTFKTDLGIFSKDRVDFGTNVLLNSLIEADVEGKQILDIGCGYGVIGLCVAKRYPASKVHLVDINLRALELTKLNQKENSLTNVSIYESNIYEGIVEKFDLILTNPPIRAGKEIVQKIVLGSIAYLNASGGIYLVIQKKQGYESLRKEMEKVFQRVEIVEKKKGYYIIKGIK